MNNLENDHQVIPETRSDHIAQTVLSGLRASALDYSLVMLGSSVYGDREKRNTAQDADFIVVITDWEDLLGLDLESFFLKCGITNTHITHTDIRFLLDKKDILLRASGRSSEFGIKCTLNFCLLEHFSLISRSFPTDFKKVAHGKSVTMKAEKTILGSSFLQERSCRDITPLFGSEERVFLQGDKKYYRTEEGIPALGVLSDSFFTGAIVDQSGINVLPLQDKLMEQYVRAQYYYLLRSLDPEDVEKYDYTYRTGVFDYTSGLARDKRFSDEYRSNLNNRLGNKANVVLGHVTKEHILSAKAPSVKRMVSRSITPTEGFDSIQTYSYEPLVANDSTEILSVDQDFIDIFEGSDNSHILNQLNVLLKSAGTQFRVLSCQKIGYVTAVNSYTAKVLGNDGHYYFIKIPKKKDLSLLSEVRNTKRLAEYMNVHSPKLVIVALDCEIGVFKWNNSPTLCQLLSSDCPDAVLDQSIGNRNRQFEDLTLNTAKRITPSAHAQAQIHSLYHKRLLRRPEELYQSHFITSNTNHISFTDMGKMTVVIEGVSFNFYDIHDSAVAVLNPLLHPDSVASLGLGDMHGNNTFVDGTTTSSFDFGNCGEHWPWLDLAKDLHINTSLEYLLLNKKCPTSSMQYDAATQTLYLETENNIDKRSRKYWITQFNFMLSLASKLEKKGLYPYDWNKILCAALYTNFIFTRSIASLPEEVQAWALTNACFFGSQLLQPNDTIIENINKWIAA